MTDKERKSCIQTIELLRRLAFNVHGVMDIIDAQNVDKIIEMLEEPESCDSKTENVLNSNWTVYGDRVKAELEAQGITTRELADRLDITPITMCRYLTGDRIPRGPVIAQTATVLNVTCDYLIGLSDDPHKTSEEN